IPPPAKRCIGPGGGGGGLRARRESGMALRNGPDQDDAEIPFWRRKSLSEMTKSEWESLCDGCGKCCLNKLEEEETDRTFYTDVGCRLLDGDSCRCRDYAHRLDKVQG